MKWQFVVMLYWIFQKLVQTRETATWTGLAYPPNLNSKCVLCFDGVEMVRFNRSVYVLNGTLEVRDWPMDLAMSTKSYQMSDNGYIQTAFGEINNILVCAVLQNDHLLIPQFLANMKLSGDCPIKPGVYEVVNFILDELPPNVPKGNLKLHYEFHPLNFPRLVLGTIELFVLIENAP